MKFSHLLSGLLILSRYASDHDESDVWGHGGQVFVEVVVGVTSADATELHKLGWARSPGVGSMTWETTEQ